MVHNSLKNSLPIMEHVPTRKSKNKNKLQLIKNTRNRMSIDESLIEDLSIIENVVR